jgi:hypothetical protein
VFRKRNAIRNITISHQSPHQLSYPVVR